MLPQVLVKTHRFGHAVWLRILPILPILDELFYFSDFFDLSNEIIIRCSYICWLYIWAVDEMFLLFCPAHNRYKRSFICSSHHHPQCLVLSPSQHPTPHSGFLWPIAFVVVILLFIYLFSFFLAVLLIAVTSLVEHRLVVVMHRFSCSKACAIFLDQDSNPCLLPRQVDALLSYQWSPIHNFFTLVLWDTTILFLHSWKFALILFLFPFLLLIYYYFFFLLFLRDSLPSSSHLFPVLGYNSVGLPNCLMYFD